MKLHYRLLLIICLISALGYSYWKFAIPTHRIGIRSELIMLGDLDGDHHWTAADLEKLVVILKNPAAAQNSIVCRMDMNQNEKIDKEDLSILRTLIAEGGDPYAAEEKARNRGEQFPRPRELYRYVTISEYRSRPVWAVPYPQASDSVLDWLADISTPVSTSSYKEVLAAAVYDEAVRFDQAWRKRQPQLLPIEREYAAKKLAHVKTLFLEGAQYEQLLALMELVEDAETLTVQGQPEFPLKLLTFRDHLREILGSPVYAEFKAGKQDWRAVLKIVSGHLQTDLGLSYDFETLGPPRNLTHLANYLQRAEWQYYKSTAGEGDLLLLIAYAQHDPRYLRAVSRTSKKHYDPNVENHNLPMVLLLREALRITGGDKKKQLACLTRQSAFPMPGSSPFHAKHCPIHLLLTTFCFPATRRTEPIRAGTGTFSVASVFTNLRRRHSTLLSSAKCKISVMTNTPRMRCVSFFEI